MVVSQKRLNCVSNRLARADTVKADLIESIKHFTFTLITAILVTLAGACFFLGNVIAPWLMVLAGVTGAYALYRRREQVKKDLALLSLRATGDKPDALQLAATAVTWAQVIAYLFGLPWYIQVALLVVAIALSVGVLLWIRQNPAKNIQVLMDLIKLAIEIIKELGNLPTPTPDPKPQCEKGYHYDEKQGECVPDEPTPTPDPECPSYFRWNGKRCEHANLPPGAELDRIGNAEVVKLGGIDQVTLADWFKGGLGWQGGTIKVMDYPDGPARPWYLFAFWLKYHGYPADWWISVQGYLNLDLDPTFPENCIQSIVADPFWREQSAPVDERIAQYAELCKTPTGTKLLELLSPKYGEHKVKEAMAAPLDPDTELGKIAIANLDDPRNGPLVLDIFCKITGYKPFAIPMRLVKAISFNAKHEPVFELHSGPKLCMGRHF
jgi:hypothetical protein